MVNKVRGRKCGKESKILTPPPSPPIEVHMDQNRSLDDAHIVLPQGWPNVNRGFC
jgi:hypothetical protein